MMVGATTIGTFSSTPPAGAAPPPPRPPAVVPHPHRVDLPLDVLVLSASQRRPCLPRWGAVVLVVVASAVVGGGLVGGLVAYFARDDANPPKSIPTPPTKNPTETASPSTSATLDSSRTLSDIRKLGYLRVGVTSQQGFATKNATGHWKGFEVDLGRAVAAGIFGHEAFQGDKKEPVEFFHLEVRDRFVSLDKNKIDLLLGITSQTLERTIYEASHRCGR